MALGLVITKGSVLVVLVGLGARRESLLLRLRRRVHLLLAVAGLWVGRVKFRLVLAGKRLLVAISLLVVVERVLFVLVLLARAVVVVMVVFSMVILDKPDGGYYCLVERIRILFLLRRLEMIGEEDKKSVMDKRTNMTTHRKKKGKEEEDGRRRSFAHFYCAGYFYRACTSSKIVRRPSQEVEVSVFGDW